MQNTFSSFLTYWACSILTNTPPLKANLNSNAIMDAFPKKGSNSRKSTHFPSSFAAELWGLREGLLLCNNLNITFLEIELDAKAIVDGLGNPSYVNNIISPLLDDCRLLISRIPQICIKHCFRQANRCADSLARMSYCLDADFSTLDSPPLDLVDHLHYILSFLPTKDAIRTSVLSTKWRYLWTGTSNFDFDDELCFGKTNNKKFELGMCLLNLVDRVLLHDAAHIQKLRLSLLFMMHVSAFRSYLWIHYVIKHNVQELDLCLPIRTTILLPPSFFTSKSLSTLKLVMDTSVLKVPSSVCFSGLKILHLSSVTFLDDQSCQLLFSGCPVLQELVLYECVWNNINGITISIPTLRRLIIYEDPLAPLQLLDTDFLFCNISSLVDASVDFTNLSSVPQAVHRAVKLLVGIQGVKSLRISNATFCVYVEPFADPGEYTEEKLMDSLQKTPNLESLDIPEGLHPNTCLIGDYWILNSVPHCLRSCLKEFSISNFSRKVAEIELLKYLLKSATILEKMMIYCSETLEADLKRQEEISNQLQILREGLVSCIIEFL
ncbi:hypothetical protein ACB092_06G067700 [Castanea dentata]